MSNHHVGHAAKLGAEIVKGMKPLPERKNPVVAFAMGLLFGALGVAVYLKSMKDFWVCIGMFIGLSIILPGIGTLLGWGFAAIYGAYRAQSSNEAQLL